MFNRYTSLHSLANTELKSSLWNLTKARRGHSHVGAEFSAESVREELRASALLELRREEEEHDIVDEAPRGRGRDADAKRRDGGGFSSSSSPGGRFVLHLDGMRAAAHRLRRDDVIAADSISDSHDKGESAGLRRRRGRGGTADPADADDGRAVASEWAIEEVAGVDEEQRRHEADPLQLFGVPPPALRSAQAEARLAMAYYVEVANLAQEMAEILRKGTSDQEPCRKC